MRPPNHDQEISTIYALDSVDWRILAIIQEDATTPNKDVADTVGIAPSTCLERVRKLRAAGVIREVRALVDPARVGRPLQAFIGVRLSPHSREAVESFLAESVAFPEAIALYNVSGEDDYLLHVAVRDTTHLQALILDRLTVLEQVDRCRTQIIFGEPLIGMVRPLADEAAAN